MTSASADSQSEQSWSIAEVAGEFGLTHRTLRHYEGLGLVSPERRGSTRVYHRRDRTRLALVLRGRRLGFSLPEIARILDMYDEQPGERGQLRYLLARIAQRREDLERRRADIEQSLSELSALERRWQQALDMVDRPSR